jgi:hypothetical protein
VKFSYDEKVERMVQFKSTIYGLTVAKEGEEAAEGEMTKEQVFKHTALLPFNILLTAVAK